MLPRATIFQSEIQAHYRILDSGLMPFFDDDLASAARLSSPKS